MMSIVLQYLLLMVDGGPDDGRIDPECMWISPDCLLIGPDCEWLGQHCKMEHPRLRAIRS
jgi:hypothetical protein